MSAEIEDDIPGGHGDGPGGIETARGEGRLQGKARHDIGVLKAEAEQIPQLIVIHASHHCHREHHLDPTLATAFDGLELGG